MICNKCGRKNDNNSKKCYFCKNKLKEVRLIKSKENQEPKQGTKATKVLAILSIVFNVLAGIITFYGILPVTAFTISLISLEKSKIIGKRWQFITSIVCLIFAIISIIYTIVMIIIGSYYIKSQTI